MSGFRVVIGGGGIAGVEGLLRLRRLVGDGVEITVVAPESELRYRPLAVKEPFAGGAVGRYPLTQIVRDADAALLEDAVEWVDGDGQVLHTREGQSLPYDALLVAVGVRSVPAFEHVTTFDDAHAEDTFLGIVKDIEEGYTKQVALLVPEGPAWSLPVYELALQTAERAFSSGFDDVTITVGDTRSSAARGLWRPGRVSGAGRARRGRGAPDHGLARRGARQPPVDRASRRPSARGRDHRLPTANRGARDPRPPE